MAIQNTCYFSTMKHNSFGMFLRNIRVSRFCNSPISGYIRELCPIYITRDACSTRRCCFCRRLFHPGRVMPAGDHLAAQITRAKRPRTTIYHRMAPSRCTAYRFSALHLCVILVLPHFRVFLVLALFLYDRPFEAKCASTSEIKFSRQLSAYIEDI